MSKSTKETADTAKQKELIAKFKSDLDDNKVFESELGRKLLRELAQYLETNLND